MARFMNKGAIVPWLGGKSPIKKKIIPLMPETKVYIEPFGGAGNVILSKGPCEVDVYNDMNPFLISFFRVIKDDDLRRKFLDKLQMSFYAREGQATSRAYLFTHDLNEETMVNLALDFYIAQNQGFSGTGSFRKSTSWGIALCNSIPARWVRGEADLQMYADRLKSITIEYMDAVQVIRKYDEEDALIYLDPPYVPSTRSMGGAATYDVDYTYEQHEELLDTLLKAKGMAIISGYPNQLYDDVLLSRGWTKQSWKVTSSAVVRTRSVGSMVGKLKEGQEECIWKSPNTPVLQLEIDMQEDDVPSFDIAN
jgi:DNA adenine methylase